MDPRTEKLLAERRQNTPSARKNFTTWLKANGPVVKLSAVAAIVVLIAAHYLLIAMPARQQERQETEALAAERLKAETATRLAAMDDCLSKAEAEAEARWKAACKARGERAGCALSVRQTEELERTEGQARNSCLIRFSTAAQ